MEKIKNWYAELDNNDQRVVMIAAIFFSFVILVFGILKPLNDKVNQLNDQVNSRQSSLDKWKQAMPVILANKGSSNANQSSMPLSSIVTTSARKYDLRVSRVQEKNANEMQIWYDNIPFNDFLRWAADTERTYQIKIDSVNIRSKDRDGLSSIDVKITKG